MDETASNINKSEDQPITTTFANSDEENMNDETSSLVTIIEWSGSEYGLDEQLDNVIMLPTTSETNFKFPFISNCKMMSNKKFLKFSIALRR